MGIHIQGDQKVSAPDDCNTEVRSTETVLITLYMYNGTALPSLRINIMYHPVLQANMQLLRSAHVYVCVGGCVWVGARAYAH